MFIIIKMKTIEYMFMLTKSKKPTTKGERDATMPVWISRSYTINIQAQIARITE